MTSERYIILKERLRRDDILPLITPEILDAVRAAGDLPNAQLAQLIAMFLRSPPWEATTTVIAVRY
jgi:hypothetical protein